MEGCSFNILSTSPPWIELPKDLTANILHRLDPAEILESAQEVCTTWWRVCHDPAMWRVIEIRYINLPRKFKMNDLIVRHLVDRSQGQLTDISLEDIGDDGLLHYICERSRHIKRLTLAYCFNMSSKGLSVAVKKIPELEELHLVAMGRNFTVEIESIGISCSILKSFTNNEYRNVHTSEHQVNAYTLAIAKSMPNLRHLRLFGNDMTNEGLEAILDGCPHLESLDIRRCANLDLEGDLGERLSRQIKSLRCPSDSTKDYEWDMFTDDCPPEYYSSESYYSSDDDWFYD